MLMVMDNVVHEIMHATNFIDIIHRKIVIIRRIYSLAKRVLRVVGYTSRSNMNE